MTPLTRAIDERLIGESNVSPAEASDSQWMAAVARLLREDLSARALRSQLQDRAHKARRIHYLSMEFLIGRSLTNAADALGLETPLREAVAARGRRFEQLQEAESDAGLGNGGLGRLAACFLDSMATLDIPAFGYGIRYQFGMFQQRIEHGAQHEVPDDWLKDGSPWELARIDRDVEVCFGGRIEHDEQGRPIWIADHCVVARAHDWFIPGHGNRRVGVLRLWKAHPKPALDMAQFNAGEFDAAAATKAYDDALSWVLYPNDSTSSGRELRLRQEYFFVCASILDIVHRHLEEHSTLENLAEHVAIHLNDTHPALAVAELMRVLVDLYAMDWTQAWHLTHQIFSYTNHTLMPEALETWSATLLQRLLPRHVDIIEQLNKELLTEVANRYPGDSARLARMSLFEAQTENPDERRIRMANLAVIGSHTVNGVSELHSKLMVDHVFKDFADFWPERFTNVTNGVTLRRWLSQANPRLSQLLDLKVGRQWRDDPERIANLKSHAYDTDLIEEFRAIKSENKRKLSELIERTTGVQVNPDSLFDVQIKRIHEYKRQLLNVLHVVSRYHDILANPSADWVPRTVIFAGKAASSYRAAKQIIHLINDVATAINQDPVIAGRLKVVFLPNYSVSLAEVIIPGADLSEQISTAGTEASGTGNMKLALNGALTIGTLDGATIEMRERVGADNMFTFGLRSEEIVTLRSNGYRPEEFIGADPSLAVALDAVADGRFSPDAPDRYRELIDDLRLFGDRYCLIADYASYRQAQHQADELFRQSAKWTTAAIENVAGMGYFSSDRAIREYAERIWGISPQR
ncbi:MAG: glycogen/starch/alpha-glucan phosphorylase [Steroidobacteraceae bacterium]